MGGTTERKKLGKKPCSTVPLILWAVVLYPCGESKIGRGKQKARYAHAQVFCENYDFEYIILSLYTV